MEILRQIFVTAKEIIKDYGSDKELNSENWGIWHSFVIKFAKSALRKTNTLSISAIQSITTSCKYLPWYGLEIENATIQNKFREQSYQFLKMYFEDKYGQYPVPIRYHWNSSVPLNIQWLTPKNRTIPDQPSTLYHIHGGAWMFMHNCINNHIFRDLTEASSGQVMGIEYRLLPQYPLLSQVEDVIAGYFYLTASKSEGGAGRSNSQIVVGGDSSGGQLTTSLLHILRNANVLGPAGAYLMSPAVDLTLSQPSFYTNSKKDVLWEEHAPTRLDSKGLHLYSNINNEIYNQSLSYVVERMIADGSPFGPKEILLWPELSTLFDTNMDNLPPTLIIVGERDSLRDFGVLYGKLRAEAEVKSNNKTTIIPNVQTYNFEDMVHSFPVLPPNKYCKKAIKTMGEFIYQALNANDQRALNSRKYKYLPNYKAAYMYSTYNMYWNNIQNQYSPWNSTYTISPFPTLKNLTDPSYIDPFSQNYVQPNFTLSATI